MAAVYPSPVEPKSPGIYAPCPAANLPEDLNVAPRPSARHLSLRIALPLVLGPAFHRTLSPRQRYENVINVLQPGYTNLSAAGKYF